MHPDVLSLPGLPPASDPAAWRQTHRPALLKLFAEHVFGHAPSAPPIRAERTTGGQLAHGTWEHWAVTVWPDCAPLGVLLCLPHGSAPAPCYLGLNFRGNHTLVPGEVPLAGGFGAYGVPVASEANWSRADWCIDGITRRGWAVCTAFYGELQPDRPDPSSLSARWRGDGQAIAAWAWLISRLTDLLCSDARIDRSRLVAVGHSRLGKAALLATAQDERIAMVVANGSGCVGAGPLREPSPGAETLAQILKFTHWFHSRLGGNPAVLPVDMHHLIACCAPRPVLLTNAEDDDWADQSGQLRVLRAAAPAWRLLGAPAAPPERLPVLGSGAQGRILRYAYRVGPHCLCPADWASIFEATAAELPTPRGDASSYLHDRG